MQENEIPLPLDAWLSSSTAQKAIRRGETDHAIMAAMAYYTHRGQGIWRRLALIAVEDIGAAGISLAQEIVMQAADRRHRLASGTELNMMLSAVMRMAAAAKDRSTDHLLSIGQEGGGELTAFREWCYGQPTEILAAIAADPHMPISKRAVATYCAVTPGPGRKLALGEPLLVLLDAFQDAGLPASVIETTLVAARLIREPIVTFLPIAASLIQRLPERPGLVEEVPPHSRIFRCVPCYAADRHTSIGKAAIRRLLTENKAVDEVVSAWVPDSKAVDVVGYALFHVEGGCVSRRIDWPGATELRETGTRIDLEKSGCATEGVNDVLAVVRANLDHLNEIRCRLLDRKPKPPR